MSKMKLVHGAGRMVRKEFNEIIWISDIELIPPRGNPQFFGQYLSG